MPTLPEDSESTLRMSEKEGGPPTVVEDEAGVSVTVRMTREKWDGLVALGNEQQARGRAMEREAILALLDTLDSDDTESKLGRLLDEFRLPDVGEQYVARAIIRVIRELIKAGEHVDS